jgi:hypothetical protein
LLNRIKRRHIQIKKKNAGYVDKVGSYYPKCGCRIDKSCTYNNNLFIVIKDSDSKNRDVFKIGAARKITSIAKFKK